MANYTVYVGGGSTIDFGSLSAAKAFIRRTWPSAVIGHDGDLSDGGDRTFCWPDDAAAVNDDGANAIATITRSDMSREEVLEMIDAGECYALCDACEWLARQTGEDCDGEYSEDSIREAVAHVDTAWLRPAGE